MQGQGSPGGWEDPCSVQGEVSFVSSGNRGKGAGAGGRVSKGASDERCVGEVGGPLFRVGGGGFGHVLSTLAGRREGISSICSVCALRAPFGTLPHGLRIRGAKCTDQGFS